MAEEIEPGMNLLVINLEQLKAIGKLGIFREFMNKNNLFAYTKIVEVK